jgi:hypothetical protein
MALQRVKAPTGSPPSVLTLAAWVCLGLSAALWLLALLCMPAGYSAWTHRVSESAGQGVPHAAWVRAGLALMGLGAALTALSGRHGPRASAACLLVFGLAMAASAFWSHRPWWPEASFDARADRLHSLAAQIAGMAFVAAIGLRIAHCWQMRRCLDALDAITAVAALLATWAMLISAPGPGAAQRVMFALATIALARHAAPDGLLNAVPAAQRQSGS